MKLSIFLKKRYLKPILIKICKFFLTVLGTMWLLIEHLVVFLPQMLQMGINLYLYFGSLLVPLVIALFLVWRDFLSSLSVDLHGTDVSIEIRVGDIFQMNGAFIISTNTTFDTDISLRSGVAGNHLISPTSLQGKFTERFYPNDVKTLDRDIKRALKNNEEYIELGNPIGKARCYEMGTVVKVNPQNQTVYLLAITNIDEKGKASSTRADVLESLTNLWKFISEQGGLDNLVIPVIGTGLTRLPQVKREEMVIEIIRSFVAACLGAKFCEKLTVIISEQDYNAHNIDLLKLGKYLQFYAT